MIYSCSPHSSRVYCAWSLSSGGGEGELSCRIALLSSVGCSPAALFSVWGCLGVLGPFPPLDAFWLADPRACIYLSHHSLFSWSHLLRPCPDYALCPVLLVCWWTWLSRSRSWKGWVDGEGERGKGDCLPSPERHLQSLVCTLRSCSRTFLLPLTGSPSINTLVGAGLFLLSMISEMKTLIECKWKIVIKKSEKYFAPDLLCMPHPS